MRAIISRKESLEILEQDLRRAEMAKHAAEINLARADRRAEILTQIDREVRKQLKQRAWRLEPDALLH